MAVRDVVTFPDFRLNQPCTALVDGVPPESIQRDALERLARDLLDTMHSFAGCAGIAAPQIGELVRMVAFDATGNRRTHSCHGELVLIDPVVVEHAGSVTMREGCLSIPDLTGDVTRAESIVVEAHTLDGRVRLACDAFEARLILHELDHLDGKLFLDRVASARHVYPRKRYR